MRSLLLPSVSILGEGLTLLLRYPAQIPLPSTITQDNQAKQKPVEIKPPNLHPNPEAEHLVKASLQLLAKVHKGELPRVGLKLENISDDAITINVPSRYHQTFVFNFYDERGIPYNYPNQFVAVDMFGNHERPYPKIPSVTLEPGCYWGTTAFLKWKSVIMDREGEFKLVAHIVLTGSVKGKKVRGWTVKTEPLNIKVYPARQEKNIEKQERDKTDSTSKN